MFRSLAHFICKYVRFAIRLATAIMVQPPLLPRADDGTHTDRDKERERGGLPWQSGTERSNLHYPCVQLNEMPTLAKHLIIAIS